ncbi:unnamed protein product, partial [Owenia fusiformis]
MNMQKQYVHLNYATAVIVLLAYSVSKVESSYICLGPRGGDWTKIGTRCFLDVHTTPKRGIQYKAAESHCKARGGHLASVHSDSEQTFMAEKMKENKLGYFIGLNDIDKEGSFVWTDGSPYSYEKWAPKQRNTYGFTGASDCAQVTGTAFNTSEWRTVPCTMRSDGFICSKEAAWSCNSTTDCHSLASCKKDRSSAATGCQCNKGYTGNGTHCEDVDECAMSLNNNCHALFATCTNTNGSYSCSCNSGYSGDGIRCREVNECSTVNSCHAFSKCKNTKGSYTCSCMRGFTGNGFNCTDIDECLDDSSKCHKSTTCVNTPGSYKCTIPVTPSTSTKTATETPTSSTAAQTSKGTTTASLYVVEYPKWTRYGPWSKCGNNNTAICSPQFRFRARMCIFSNGSVVSEDLCDGGEDAAYQKACCKGEACKIMCARNMDKTGVRNWAVGLERSNPLPERYCHGILLHNYWVLTGAHCVCHEKQKCCSQDTKRSDSSWRIDIRKCDYRRWKIRALDPNPDNDIAEGLRNFQDDIHPSRIIIHDKYAITDYTTLKNDLALIRLKTPIRMGAGNDDPRPALLPRVICSDYTKDENTCSTHWTDSLMQDCFATIDGRTYANRGVTKLKVFEDAFNHKSPDDVKAYGVTLEGSGQFSK